eukprot:RCo022037
MVPPGAHMVYYAVVRLSGERGERSSFFVWVEPGEVAVFQWCGATERLIRTAQEERDQKRWECEVRNFEHDAFLGAYPLHSLPRWRELSSLLSKPSIARLEDRSEDGRVPYTVLPSLREAAAKLDPSEITRRGVDRSVELDAVISRRGSDSEVLAELQHSFLSFLLGYALDGFEHWKALVMLWCGCEEALWGRGHSGGFVAFLRALRAQLQHLPTDLFAEFGFSGNFLAVSLSGLLQSVLEPPAEEVPQKRNPESSLAAVAPVGHPSALRAEATAVRQAFLEKFGVDLADPLGGGGELGGEDGPVVVELPS